VMGAETSEVITYTVCNAATASYFLSSAGVRRTDPS